VTLVAFVGDLGRGCLQWWVGSQMSSGFQASALNEPVSLFSWCWQGDFYWSREILVMDSLSGCMLWSSVGDEVRILHYCSTTC